MLTGVNPLLLICQIVIYIYLLVKQKIICYGNGVQSETTQEGEQVSYLIISRVNAGSRAEVHFRECDSVELRRAARNVKHVERIDDERDLVIVTLKFGVVAPACCDERAAEVAQVAAHIWGKYEARTRAKRARNARRRQQYLNRKISQ